MDDGVDVGKIIGEVRQLNADIGDLYAQAGVKSRRRKQLVQTLVTLGTLDSVSERVGLSIARIHQIIGGSTRAVRGQAR